MLRAPKPSSPNNNNTNARRSKRMPSVDVGTTGRKMHSRVDFEASHFECKMSFCREKRRERKMVGIEGTTTKKKKRRDDIESDY